MLTRPGRWLLMPLVWILGASAANADQIELNNGDRLTGTLEGISAGKALLNTGYAGTIPVSLNEIKGLHTEQDFRVRTATGMIHGRFVTGESGQGLATQTQTHPISLVGIRNASQRRLALMRLASEWKSRADVGLVISSGNSDTQSLNTIVETLYKAEVSQHQASVRVSNEEADAQATKDQLDFDYGYKRFMSERWYVAVNAEYFTDDLKDVESRITLGLGSGYQFWDDTFGGLSVEAGISEVRERIGGAKGRDVEEDHPALRLALDYKKLLLARRLELFHKQSMLIIPDSDRGEVISASTGVRFALSDKIDTIARVDLNLETKPVPGNSKTDVTYTVGIGVKF